MRTEQELLKKLNYFENSLESIKDIMSRNNSKYDEQALEFEYQRYNCQINLLKWILDVKQEIVELKEVDFD